MAQSPSYYRRSGRLVAQAGTLLWDQLADQYGTLLMEGMQAIATPRQHYNVLQHLMGFLKETLGTDDKRELLSLMDDYRQVLWKRGGLWQEKYG